MALLPHTGTRVATNLRASKTIAVLRLRRYFLLGKAVPREACSCYETSPDHSCEDILFPGARHSAPAGARRGCFVVFLVFFYGLFLSTCLRSVQFFLIVFATPAVLCFLGLHAYETPLTCTPALAPCIDCRRLQLPRSKPPPAQTALCIRTATPGGYAPGCVGGGPKTEAAGSPTLAATGCPICPEK